MKSIKSIILALLITIVPMQNSRAAVGVVYGAVGLGWGPAAYALDLMYVSANIPNPALGFLGILAGIVLLDEEGKPSFGELNSEQAKKLNITKSEMDIYNGEVDQANIIFAEVASELNADSTREQAKASWANYEDMLSPETMKTMKAIVSHK